jgi:hypothetical protein
MVVIMIGGCSGQATRSVDENSDTGGVAVLAGVWIFVVMSAA